MNAGDLSTRSISYSTHDLPVKQRRDWLREVIGREYAHVDITSPTSGTIFTEMTLYPWDALRLSVIRSDEITLRRLPSEPDSISHDVYFAVVHLAGDYLLQQNGREVLLQPGDIAFYDATLHHRLQCSRDFSKLMVSIPRALLRDRVAGVEQCTALRIPGNTGIGSVAASFIRSCANQAEHLNAGEFSKLSGYALDLLTLAMVSVRPSCFNLSRSRAIALNRVKSCIENKLSDPALTPAKIASETCLSPRYINLLFRDEDTSLMRYVWRRRLECCREDMLSLVCVGHRVSEIAFRWGFNDLSHFSRLFRQHFGCSPTEYREAHQREVLAAAVRPMPAKRGGYET